MEKYKITWERISLLAVVLVGLAARVLELGHDLDGDEIFSVKLASKQFSEVIVGSMQDSPHPPLHNVLLHLWIKAFGTAEVSVRMLSILCSGAFLVTAYTLLRRFMATWLAVGALAILALSPLFVFYGQQARPYALIGFLMSANLLAFVRLLEEPQDRRRIWLWAALCALLVYAQYLAVVFIGAQIAFALWHARAAGLRVLGYGVIATSLILPWIAAAMGEAVRHGADPLPQISWIEPPDLNDLVQFYVKVFGEVPGVQSRWLLIVLAVLGLAYLRRLWASRELPFSHLFLWGIGVGVPVALYIVSVMGPKSVLVPRQMLGAGIAFVALLGLFMASLPRKAAAGSLLILLAWTAVALADTLMHGRMAPSWRVVATEIDTQYGALPIVAQEGWVTLPVSYYRRSGPVRLWSELADHERGQRVLFLCRPFACSVAEEEASACRRSLLTSWHWGRPGEFTPYNQLRLYAIDECR